QGQYEIRLAETRSATEKDLALDEARKLFTEVNNLWRANSYDKALPLAERVVDIHTKYSGSDSLGLSSALVALANQYDGKGEEDKAEPLFLRALDIREKVLGKDDISSAGIWANLTTLYGDRGDYVKAEWAAQRALEIREKALQPNSSLIANS